MTAFVICAAVANSPSIFVYNVSSESNSTKRNLIRLHKIIIEISLFI
jgi:hypothetical protein